MDIQKEPSSEPLVAVLLMVSVTVLTGPAISTLNEAVLVVFAILILPEEIFAVGVPLDATVRMLEPPPSVVRVMFCGAATF